VPLHWFIDFRVAGRGVAGPGRSWHGAAGSVAARPGAVWQGAARHGAVCHGEGEGGHGAPSGSFIHFRVAWPGMAGCGAAVRGPARTGAAWRGKGEGGLRMRPPLVYPFSRGRLGFGWARRGLAWQDLASLGRARLGRGRGDTVALRSVICG